jgi:hypothetical protein
MRARYHDRLFDEAGLGAAAARRRLRGMARDAPGGARNARQQLIDTDWDAPVSKPSPLPKLADFQAVESRCRKSSQEVLGDVPRCPCVLPGEPA